MAGDGELHGVDLITANCGQMAEEVEIPAEVGFGWDEKSGVTSPASKVHRVVRGEVLSSHEQDGYASQPDAGGIPFSCIMRRRDDKALKRHNSSTAKGKA